MTHLDLFSGIGGFALAAKWCGIRTIQFCEIDPFCQKVLAKNFPGVPIHDDIKTFTYATAIENDKRESRYMGEATSSGEGGDDAVSSGDQSAPFLLTGGFPCQPFSCAGKRRGKKDDRYLWPQMLRVVSEAKPDWVIGENVAGFINMGLDDCISDLEAEGYEVQAFVIPACAVGAPHRRNRVWIIANLRSGRPEKRGAPLPGYESREAFPCNADRHAPDTDRFNGDDAGLCASEISQLEEAEICGGDVGYSDIPRTESIAPASGSWDSAGESDWGTPWPEVAARLCRVDDGLPRQVDRVNRLKALGNAIVPQVAFEIMRVILEVEREGENGNKFVSSRWGVGSGG